MMKLKSAYLGLLLLLVIGSGCGRSEVERQATRAPADYTQEWFGMSEDFAFNDLDQMVVSVDAVALVTVEDTHVTPASKTPDVLGLSDESVRHSSMMVDLRLDQQLAGQKELPSTFSILNYPASMYGAKGESGREWRTKGAQAVLFLVYSEEAVEVGRPGWQFLNSQAAYIVNDEDVAPTAKEDELGEEIGELTLTELKERVDEAEAKGERGEVEPAPL